MSAGPGAASGWGVLGGGMLGLTLALRLAQAGERVTVLEAAPAVGGLTSCWSHDGCRWDRFYHVIEASDRHLLSLLEELDLGEALRWGVTRTNFFDGEALYPLNDVFDYLRLPALGLLDKLRLGVNIVYGAARRDGRALESLRAEDWLVRWSGRRAWEQLWRPLLRAKLGANADHASAAYVWSVIHRFYGARQGSTRTELFGYVDGGYGRIVDALLERLAALGVHVETGAPVARLDAADGGFTVDAGARAHRFARVVATYPSPVAARTLDVLGEDERARHAALRYQGVVCASLLLTRPLGGAYLTYITDTSAPFTTVIEMTSLVDRAVVGGRHLVYLPRYVPSDDPFLDADDAAVREAFLPGLEQMFPDLEPAEIVDFRVARARHVLAVPTLGYSDVLPPVRTATPGLYVCNGAQIVNASLSVTEVVELANRTAAALQAA